MQPSLASPSGGPTVWVTGSPRTDLLLAATTALPEDLRAGVSARDIVGDRRLILLLPADRDNGHPTALSTAELARVVHLADQHAAVVGVRRAHTDVHPDERVLDLSAGLFPDVEMVLESRRSWSPTTPPSCSTSCTTDRPVVCLPATDLDAVRQAPGLSTTSPSSCQAGSSATLTPW